jgi:hypothetical protein
MDRLSFPVSVYFVHTVRRVYENGSIDGENCYCNYLQFFHNCKCASRVICIMILLCTLVYLMTLYQLFTLCRFNER